MKKILLTFTILTFIILINSCSRPDENNNCQERSDMYSLERNKDIISFNLDSLTSPNVDYLKIVDINDTLFFTLLNTYNNTIYCYEYSSKKLYKTIQLTSSKKITGYEIISWNRILTYQYWSYNLTLQDNNGKILDSIIVPKKGDGYYSFPNSHAPVIYKDKSIYLAGGMMSKKNQIKHLRWWRK